VLVATKEPALGRLWCDKSFSFPCQLPRPCRPRSRLCRWLEECRTRRCSRSKSF